MVYEEKGGLILESAPLTVAAGTVELYGRKVNAYGCLSGFLERKSKVQRGG